MVTAWVAVRFLFVGWRLCASCERSHGAVAKDKANRVKRSVKTDRAGQPRPRQQKTDRQTDMA